MNRQGLRWVRAVVALAMAMALAGWWAVTTNDMHDRSPDGEVAVGQYWQAPRGERVRVVKWAVVEQLASFEQPTKPKDGMVFVVVTLQFTNSHENAHCDPLLFGRGTQNWREAQGSFDIAKALACQKDANVTTNTVYEVPRTKVDELRGVSFKNFEKQERQPALLLFGQRS